MAGALQSRNSLQQVLSKQYLCVSRDPPPPLVLRIGFQALDSPCKGGVECEEAKGSDLCQPSAEFFHNMDYFKYHNMRPPFTYATLIRWVSRAA